MRWLLGGSQVEHGDKSAAVDQSTSLSNTDSTSAAQSTSSTRSTSPTASTSTASSSSTSTDSPAPEKAHLLNRFEWALQDEEKYQEQQYPTFEEVPGCMRLFDEFLMCYALVPQLRNMYRYGELRDCNNKFDDFKYCMSLKGEDVEERRKLWIRRRAEWWARRRAGTSSEDVWDVRREPLENFPPLQPDLDEAEGGAKA